MSAPFLSSASPLRNATATTTTTATTSSKPSSSRTAAATATAVVPVASVPDITPSHHHLYFPKSVPSPSTRIENILLITNNSNQPAIWKMRRSTNTPFLVHPTSGVVHPREERRISITCTGEQLQPLIDNADLTSQEKLQINARFFHESDNPENVAECWNNKKADGMKKLKIDLPVVLADNNNNNSSGTGGGGGGSGSGNQKTATTTTTTPASANERRSASSQPQPQKQQQPQQQQLLVATSPVPSHPHQQRQQQPPEITNSSSNMSTTAVSGSPSTTKRAVDSANPQEQQQQLPSQVQRSLSQAQPEQQRQQLQQQQPAERKPSFRIAHNQPSGSGNADKQAPPPSSSSSLSAASLRHENSLVTPAESLAVSPNSSTTNTNLISTKLNLNSAAASSTTTTSVMNSPKHVVTQNNNNNNNNALPQQNQQEEKKSFAEKVLLATIPIYVFVPLLLVAFSLGARFGGGELNSGSSATAKLVVVDGENKK